MNNSLISHYTDFRITAYYTYTHTSFSGVVQFVNITLVLRLYGTLVYVITLSVDTRWRGWLRCCATNRKVGGSISDGVIRIFH